jgi:predicted membrane chloride channel (bestrophin family)
MLDLSAPRVITFIASVVIALAAVVVHYAHIAVPFSRTGFTILLVAYALLAAGNVFRDV